MTGSKADIITALQKDMLSLQGFKPALNNTAVDVLPAAIKNAFPNASFPWGAIHEFIAGNMEDSAATSGFVGGLLSSIMKKVGVAIWISSCRTIFPPALKLLGIAPDKIIFIDLKKEKEILWAMEEALKCNGVSAVIGEMQELSFTASRRLQLAVEQSQVTGFILRRNPRSLNITACVSRWKIAASASEFSDAIPGVGFPRWNVELLKIRNGKPGSWVIEFKEGRFKLISSIAIVSLEQKKKAG